SMLVAGVGSGKVRPPVPTARESLLAVDPYVNSATLARPDAMSRAAWAAWNWYELPPTAVVSMTRGVMPKYSATIVPDIAPASPASYNASTSDQVRPASASALAAETALICSLLRPSTLRSGYSWTPAMAAVRSGMRDSRGRARRTS